MSKFKKIAIIHNLTGGGAFRVFIETNKFLSKRYKITVFSPPKIGSANNPIKKVIGYIVYIYKTLPQHYKKIANEINTSGYDAAIIHHDSYLKSPTALFHLKIKTIYILHEPPREFYEPLNLHAPSLIDKLFNVIRLPIFFIDKMAVKKAKHVIVNSKFSKERIDKIYGVNSYVIYPGVKNTQSRAKTKNDRKDILSVGSLLPYKGHELTIAALGTIENKPKLIVVGNGRDSEIKHLLNLAKKNKVSIKIISDTTDRRLSSLYKKSKLYVNSAYQEPFGITSLEAISHGVNLVTVENCGTEELKKFFKDRVVIVKRDFKQIAIGIADMLTVENKIQTIPSIFTWDHYVSKLTDVIEYE